MMQNFQLHVDVQLTHESAQGMPDTMCTYTMFLRFMSLHAKHHVQTVWDIQGVPHMLCFKWSALFLAHAKTHASNGESLLSF